MTDIFIQAINLSISASYLVLAILAVRLLLKKAPKWVNMALWGLVAVRLIFPFSLESVLSLLPSAQPVPPNIGSMENPGLQTGLPVLDGVINPVIQEQFRPIPEYSTSPLQLWLLIAAAVWILGALVMLGYTSFSYLRLRGQVRTAVRMEKNIYRSEHIDSPFVLGLIRPRIYLPTGLNSQDMPHVIAHERAHIQRRDHWWKPLGFLLLSVYWFNPLLWVAYMLLCRDIELACDEKVIQALGHDIRVDYSQALLSCSVSRKNIAACPLAFGEVGIKQRIKSVLNYKKPGFWVMCVALVACIALGVFFLTDPVVADQTTPTATEPAPTTQPPVTTPPVTTPPATQPPSKDPIILDSDGLGSNYTDGRDPQPSITWAEYKDNDYFKLIGGYTREQINYFFGTEGIPVGYTGYYFWPTPDNGSLFVQFIEKTGLPSSSTWFDQTRYPDTNTGDPEGARQQLLGLASGDISHVTLTGEYDHSGSVTLPVSMDLALEAIAMLRENAREATYVGRSMLVGHTYDQYLTVYLKDGTTLELDFYSFLGINGYFFAPSAQQQQAFQSRLYPALMRLLAEPVRQNIRQRQPHPGEWMTVRNLELDTTTRQAVYGWLGEHVGSYAGYGDIYSWCCSKECKSFSIHCAFADDCSRTYTIYIFADGYVWVDGFLFHCDRNEGWWEELTALHSV